jgi:tetratricopeptide (TPR) repeat protein
LKTLEINPYYRQVHLNLGVIYYQQGDWDAAEIEFLKELQVNRGFEAAYAYNNLGNVKLRQGKIEEALANYRQALKIYPNYKDGKYNLGRTYEDLAMLKVSQDSLFLAKQYFEKALEMEVKKPIVHYNYGLVLGELGYEAEALKQMEKALELDRNFEPALKVLKKIKKKGMEEK